MLPVYTWARPHSALHASSKDSVPIREFQLFRIRENSFLSNRTDKNRRADNCTPFGDRQRCDLKLAY
jgi:hypothetical protein